ncbi:MAG TPA: hypothetical protein VGG89_10000 [Candidatus Baltobacteraceae bacterium]
MRIASLRRSAFIAGIAALAGCTRAASGGDLDAFMTKSKALTGYADLDAQLGATYFQIAGASAPDRAILTLWYTGIDGAKATTVTWLQALAWRACSFTKPPSQCAAPGSWHYKP